MSAAERYGSGCRSGKVQLYDLMNVLLPNFIKIGIPDRSAACADGVESFTGNGKFYTTGENSFRIYCCHLRHVSKIDERTLLFRVDTCHKAKS